MRISIIGSLVFSICACAAPAPHELPATVEEETGVQVVITTPAGATAQGHYDPDSKEIRADSTQLHFLPFPGNWGFVPSTHMPYQGDRVFAPVELAGHRSLLILAVPSDTARRNLYLTSLNELRINYPGVFDSLEAWLRQWQGDPPARILDWKDEGYARRFIQASMPEKEAGG